MVQCVIGEPTMLSWFAFTFNAARLGLEAQNAAVLRLLRLAGGVSKAAADEILPEQMAVHTEAPPDRRPIPPKRRHASRKIDKKSAPVRKRGKRAK